MEVGTKNKDLDPRSQQKPGEAPRILNREVYFCGQTIIEQGDDAFRAYYIERGRAGVWVHDGRTELKVAELGPGDIFGEMALINHGRRTASVRALEDITVTVISRDEIEGKIDRIQDKAIRALINVLAERLRNSTKGQVHYYKDLTDFQDRVTGVVDSVHLGIDEDDREAFREEVTPLLDELQKVLDRYQK